MFTKSLNNFFNYFTFRQRFLLFAGIFALCFPFPLYWVIEGQNLYIEGAKNQIENFKNQKILNSLLNDFLRYHLSSDTTNDLNNVKSSIKNILYDLKAIKEQSTIDNNFKKISNNNTDLLMQLWERISNKKSPDKFVDFEQKERFIEIILEKLKFETRDQGLPSVNLLPDNSIINFILYELYRTQVFSIKLLTLDSLMKQDAQNQEKYKLSYYISLNNLQDAISEIQMKLNNSVQFQSFDLGLLVSLTNDATKHQNTNGKNTISVYLKNLNDWIETIENHGEKQSQISVKDFLGDSRHITDKLINLGISFNQQNKDLHVLFRNVCVFVIFIAICVVLFYIFFHVLTIHFFELENHIQSLSKGKIKKCFCSDAGDEFGPVGKAFDKMSKTVQQVVKELQRLGRQLVESTKQIAQSTIDQNNAFLNDEKKIKEVEDYTKMIASRTQIFAKMMNELSLSTQQNNMSQIAKTTLEKMRITISSLTLRSTNILLHLTTLKGKLEGNKDLFTFLAKVSNQAALLSLNSAIEASNIITGKQSFIKITHEIKRFADKTLASTGNMQEIINGIFLSVDHIYNDTNKFLNELNVGDQKLNILEKHLSHMSTQIEDQKEKFQSVNIIMQNQSNITDEIKKSLDSLVNIATDNSNQTRNLGKTIDELSITTEKLQHILNLFFHPKQRQKLSRLHHNE